MNYEKGRLVAVVSYGYGRQVVVIVNCGKGRLVLVACL